MRIHSYFKIIKVDYADSEYFRLHNETDTLGTFTCTREGTPTAPNLEYSIDGVNWTTAVMTATWTTQVPARGNIYLRGNNGTNGFNRSERNNYRLKMDVDHSAHGNVMSIQNYTTMTTVTAVPDYCFAFLFYEDTKLINASGVNFGNVTRIGQYGCYRLFNICSALTTAPDLSHLTSVGDYGCQNMFAKCSALTTAPNLSNITSVGIAGYNAMFASCSALTTAPDLSHLTSVGDRGCEYMFTSCSALTTAPDLSNVTSIGEYGCQYMFNICSALTTAPDLSNVTSIGEYGCQYMFSGCYKLQTVYAPNLTTWSTSIFDSWVNNAGRDAATPKIMYFKTQALMDSCPSGTSGYGKYTKQLL